MFCYNCGKPLVEGARFCSYCGTSVPNSIMAVESSPNVKESLRPKKAKEEPFQLQRYEYSFIEYNNDFWWREFVDIDGHKKVLLNCIYEENGTWHRIKKMIQDEAFSEGNLVPIGGNLYLFLYVEGEYTGASYLCKCERNNNTIKVIKEKCSGVSAFSSKDYFAPIINGNLLYNYTTQGVFRWEIFDVANRSYSTKELIKPKCMNDYDREWYHEEIKKLNLFQPFLCKNGKIYAGMAGLASFIFEFRLDDMDNIYHVNKPNNKFILADNCFLSGNTLIDFDKITSARLSLLKLDDMTTKNLTHKGSEFRNPFTINDSIFFQIKFEGSPVATFLFDVETYKCIPTEGIFSYYDSDNDLDEVIIERTGYSQKNLAFAYTTDDDKIHYSVVPKDVLQIKGTRIVDYEL